MDTTERTRDVYEQLAAYPKAPLVPLPGPEELGPFLGPDPRTGRLARWIARAALSATGFRAFQRRLPETIEDLLRRTHLRLPGLFAPITSATLALEDDPRGPDPLRRTATLILAVQDFHRALYSGTLEPDTLRGEPREMGQYPNFFSTCMIVEGGRTRVFKSAKTSQLTVAIAGRLFALKIGAPGSGTTLGQLEHALSELVERVRRDGPLRDPPPCLLTAGTGPTQFWIFRELGKHGTNTASLELLRHSLFTLCLDLEESPSSHAAAALAAHARNPENRWYHSSLQLVVFGNGRACAICNFTTYLDGNTMMRGAAEIQRRAAACPLDDGPKQGATPLPRATELRWQIDPRLLEGPRKELQAIRDDQQATFELEGLGRRALVDRGLEPIPTFMLALHLTARRLIGQPARMEQFMAMSKYRCMDLTTADVATPEAMRFVEYLGGADVQPDRARELLQEAIRSQARESRRARSQLSLPVLFNLFALNAKGLRRVYVGAIAFLAFSALRRLGAFRPASPEIVASHPEIYPQVRVVGRPGIRLPYLKYFGIHYQLMEDRTVITLMPSISWKVPNAELIAELRHDLERILALVPVASLAA